MTHFKLVAELERDIRNQVVIDQMKRLNTRGKIMVYLRTHIRQLALLRMTHFKLVAELERDIHNQVVIDQMKRLNTRGKIMVYLRTHIRQLALLGNFVVLALLAFGIARAFADEIVHVPCPNPGQPCKVLILTPEEEQILMRPNGILDTAAQARNLDLGQFSVYLKTRIASSPAGEMKPVAKPAESQGNPAKGAGPEVPANKPVDNPK